LKPYGVRPVFSENVESASTADWLRLLRRSDVVLYVGYSGPGPYTIRQLALAGCIGKPIVRWWVGSDVLYCTEDRVNARRAKVLDRLCSEAVTGAPHLQRELASIGIDAKLIPTVVDPAFLENDSSRGEVGREILVYLPTERGPFYGEEFVAAAIRENPDLRFIVVADAQHRFRSYKNVESLGWVENMRPIYDRAGCLLRITQHDSLPRMAIEMLLLGKYVISSYEFPGCWQAKDSRDVQKWISVFRTRDSQNVTGMNAIRKLLNPSPGFQFAALLRKSAHKQRLVARMSAIFAVLPLTLWSRIRNQET
jgi:hypothetical protein